MTERPTVGIDQRDRELFEQMVDTQEKAITTPERGDGTSGPWYVFMTPKDSYALRVEERPNDEYDRFCVTVTNDYGYDDWTSDRDLRGAIGVAVMRIIRHENGGD